MANTKKKHHVTHKRRKKVGAAGDAVEFVVRVVGVSAGAVLGAYIVQGLNTALGSNIPAWGAPSMIGVAGGVMNLPVIAKKAPVVADFGLGLVGAGALLGLNQAGLNIPGISGMAMTNNAPPSSNVLYKAVGCNRPRNGVGAAPSNYLTRVVGARMTRNRKHTMSVGHIGALTMD
jgi:hypothetical protein